MTSTLARELVGPDRVPVGVIDGFSQEQRGPIRERDDEYRGKLCSGEYMERRVALLREEKQSRFWTALGRHLNYFDVGLLDDAPDCMDV